MSLGPIVAMIWSVLAIAAWAVYSAMKPMLTIGRVVRRRIARSAPSTARSLSTAEVIYLRHRQRG
jgi:hypothetical protein